MNPPPLNRPANGCHDMAMPPRRPPHIETFKTRHGARLWYFRIGKGTRVRLPDTYGSKEFWKAYDEALAGRKTDTGDAERLTLAWLIDQYQESPQWLTLAKETRKQFKYQFQRMRERAGKAPIVQIDAASIAKGRDERAHKPTDANKYIKASRKLYGFAVERGWRKINPAKDVSLVKLPNRATGFHTWTEEEVAAYEAKWPLGTRERLAMDLLIYTGVRRSDVVKLGRQHVRDGAIAIKTEKSVNMGHPVAIEITILPPLAKSIDATKTGDLAFLVTSKNKPFGKESFGTWFKKACVAAGVPGSAHGLRKIAAVRCAENGATEAELNAMFGWAEGSKESATYVRKASRARLGRNASGKMLPQTFPQTDTQVIVKLEKK